MRIGASPISMPLIGAPPGVPAIALRQTSSPADPECADDADARDHHAPSRAHASTLQIASTALCPPNPNPEQSAVRMTWLRAVRTWSTPTQAGSR